MFIKITFCLKGLTPGLTNVVTGHERTLSPLQLQLPLSCGHTSIFPDYMLLVPRKHNGDEGAFVERQGGDGGDCGAGVGWRQAQQAPSILRLQQMPRSVYLRCG